MLREELLSASGAGDYAIAVRWLGRASEDSQLRTFELDKTSAQVVINSTELRWSDIELLRVRPLGPAPHRSSRKATKTQSGGEQRPLRYELPVEIEQAILQECW